MEAVKLISHCKRRAENPFQIGLKTRKNSDRSWTVYYAAQKQCDPHDFKAAGLSILPISKNGFAIEAYTQNGKNWDTFYGVDDWQKETWKQSYGVQIYTGEVSGFVTDLDFEYEIIADYPDAFAEMLRRLCDLAVTPLLTVSKGGGLRFTSRTPDYVHSNRTEQKEYIGDYSVNPRRLYLEVFGTKGLSRYDARYEIVEGSLWDIPVIPADAIFNIVDDYRYEIGTPYQKPKSKPKNTITPSKQRPKKTKSPVKKAKGTRPTAEYDENGKPVGIQWREPDENGTRISKQIYECNMTDHKKSDGDMRFYRSVDGKLSQFCHNCQTSKILWRPQKARKPIKLEKSHLNCVLEVLEQTGKRIAEAFESGKRFIGLRADTGTGKTEHAIWYFLKGHAGVFSTPTTELAKDIFDRFWAAGINAFRWRGLGSEPDGQFPHEKPCMFPDEYQALAESGRNAYLLLCEPCPFHVECEADGFRSQEEKAKKANVVVAPHPDLLMNPTFRRVAVRLLPGRKDDLVLLDEFDALRFLEIKIPKARLKYLRDTWHDHELGDLAIDILRTSADPKNLYAALRKLIDDINDRGGTRDKIITALGNLRIGDTIMDTDEAHDYEIRTRLPLDLESIKKRPKLEDNDWNLLVQLELFFDVYRHAETAPILWNDDNLIFYLPPLPLPIKSKVILMSATLVKEFFLQVFSARQLKRGDVDFIDAADTEWHPDAKVFQLRTNRNPRRTLLTGEQDENTGKWKYTGELSRTGEKYRQHITDFMTAQPNMKHGLIAHKAIIEYHTDDLQRETGVVCEHFGNLVGLDSKFKGIDVLQILGSPNVGSEAVETHSKMMFGMTEKSLDFTRNEDGSYADKNVQKVADALVKSELTQAIGRARLVRNPARVVIWTSQELPSVTHREQTRLFDEVDFQQAEGNLERLEEIIAEREAREATEAEAIKKGDVQGVVAATGVSERTARRRTEAARKAHKNSEEAQLRTSAEKRLSQNVSQTKTARELGISRKKLKRILEM